MEMEGSKIKIAGIKKKKKNKVVSNLRNQKIKKNKRETWMIHLAVRMKTLKKKEFK